MLIKRHAELTDNDVTDPELYKNRRNFIQSGFALAAGAVEYGRARGRRVVNVVVPVAL